MWSPPRLKLNLNTLYRDGAVIGMGAVVTKNIGPYENMGEVTCTAN